jgi:hypothetical protein
VAFGWKAIAFPIFSVFPLLRPSVDAEHGLLLVTLAAVSAVVLGRRQAADEASSTRLRVAEAPRYRFADPVTDSIAEEGEEAASEVDVRAKRASR